MCLRIFIPKNSQMEQILPKDVVTLLNPHMWRNTSITDLKEMYNTTIDSMMDQLALARTSKGARHAYREIWPKMIDAFYLQRDDTKKNQLWWFMSQFLTMSLQVGAVDFVLFVKDGSRFIIDKKGQELVYNVNYRNIPPLSFIVDMWDGLYDKSHLPRFIYEVFVHGYCFKKTADDTNAICSKCPSTATFTCIRTDANFCNKCALFT